MPEMINIGGLVADLDLNTSKLDRGLANAERALHVIKLELIELQGKLARGEISQNDYARASGYLSRSQQEIRDAMTAATNAVNQQNNATKNAAASAKALAEAMRRSQAAGMALMQLGYIVDDIQYGMRSVVNNIGPFTYSVTTAFGMATESAMKLSAGVQIVGVLAYQAYVNWDRLMDGMGLGRVLTESEEMDALAKSTSRTADETARLNKYKREQKEIQDLMEARPKAQTRQEKIARDAVAEIGDEKATGGEKLAKAFADSFRAQGLGEKITQKEQAELDRLKAETEARLPGPKGFVEMMGMDPLGMGGMDVAPDPKQEERRVAAARAELEQKQKEINDRINAADADRAKKAANDAVKDVDQRRAAIRRLEPNPANREIVEALKATLPENVMAKNLGNIWGKVKEKGQEALNHFFEEDKKKRTQAANEEQDFYENAQSVFKSAVNETKGMAPAGSDKAAQFATMQAMLTGDTQSMQTVRAMIQAELEKQGINKGVSGAAADEILKDADKKVKEDVLNEHMKIEPQRKSQQFDASELAARVQAGVGGDESKKHTTLFKQMVKSLAIIEEASGHIPFGAE